MSPKTGEIYQEKSFLNYRYLIISISSYDCSYLCLDELEVNNIIYSTSEDTFDEKYFRKTK